MALDFIAGCLGGCAGVAVGHPFDTVKVKLQTQDIKNPVYRGTWDCFSKILQTESLAGMYRGVWSPLCGVALVNAIVFGVYGNLQRNFAGQESLRSHFLVGAAAGLAQSVVSSPVELVKTRMQTSSSCQGTISCLMDVIKGEGIRGVFKGLSITGARDFLGYGFYFATYEAMTKMSPSETPVGTPMMLLAGGISGTVSWVLTYPLDVIKTRFQVDIGSYSGLTDCLKKSIQSEGISCLGRGLLPTIIRAFPSNAVTFTVVSWVMRFGDHSANGSLSMDKMFNSVLEKITKETHVLNNAELINKPVNSLRSICLPRINAQRYFLMSEDLWVDGVDDKHLDESLHVLSLKISRDYNANENKLEADLLAAELKMFDDLAREMKESDYDVNMKPVQTEKEYKSGKR